MLGNVWVSKMLFSKKTSCEFHKMESVFFCCVCSLHVCFCVFCLRFFVSWLFAKILGRRDLEHLRKVCVRGPPAWTLQISPFNGGTQDFPQRGGKSASGPPSFEIFHGFQANKRDRPQILHRFSTLQEQTLDTDFQRHFSSDSSQTLPGFMEVDLAISTVNINMIPVGFECGGGAGRGGGGGGGGRSTGHNKAQYLGNC